LFATDIEVSIGNGRFTTLVSQHWKGRRFGNHDPIRRFFWPLLNFEWVAARIDPSLGPLSEAT
jgi:hypothetical protein